MSDARRSEQLRNEIEHVASEIDDDLLSLASDEAREEWVSARIQWRGGAGARKMVADDLELVLTKVRRFGDILRDMKGRAAIEACLAAGAAPRSWGGGRPHGSRTLPAASRPPRET
jgi:hypothetical protein